MSQMINRGCELVIAHVLYIVQRWAFGSAEPPMMVNLSYFHAQWPSSVQKMAF